MLASIFGVILSYLVTYVSSHGRLIEPPSRASMWRYGFSTPPNYNDHELYCGGFTRQWQVNGGKCGICGDPWEAPKPRPHEAGGKYAQGIIVRKYKIGSQFTIRVELTANHRGYFEFRLCPNNNPKVTATQECLDKYVLRRSKMSTREPDDVFHETRFYPGPENKVYEIRYTLPPDLTCSQCVLQWKYIAGNNWGMCQNNTGAVGCGPQEEFRSCADIQISDVKGDSDDTPYPTPATTTKPTRRPTKPTTSTPTTSTTSSSKPDEGTTDIDNEIPTDEDIVKANYISNYIMYSLLTIIMAFIIVVIIFFTIYIYYYHIDKYNDNNNKNKTKLVNENNNNSLFNNLKQIINNTWNNTKNILVKNKINTSSDKSKNNTTSETINTSDSQINVPIPPPRIKKNTTIGFKGVPENLV